MHSPAQAFAWLFWWRHRWGLLAGIIYLLTAAAIVALVPADMRTRLLGLNLTMTGLGVVLHLMVVFSFGAETDLANKESGYPPRMFVLPLTTRTLVRWPMFGGLAAVSLAWLMLAGLVLRPCGFAFAWWPWGCLTVLLALLQALAWMPFTSSYQRLVIVLLLAGGSALAGLGLIWAEASQGVFVAAFVLAWLFGYRLALVAVARARRGDPVRWPWSSFALKLAIDVSHSGDPPLRGGESFLVAPTLRGGEGFSPSPTASQRPLTTLGNLLIGRWPRRSRVPAAFQSASRAQLWYECRRHGWLLPLFMAVMLLLFIPMLFVTPSGVVPPWRIAVVVISLAPFLAGIGSTAFAKDDPFAKTYALSSFTATRPLSSARMVGIKFANAGITAGLMCGLSLLVLAPWFFRADIQSSFAPFWQGVPGWKVAIVCLLAAVVWLAITWKQIVASLSFGLTGRSWLVNAVGIGYGMLFISAFVIGGWFVAYPQHLAVVGAWLPTIVIAALVAKAVAAVAVWRVERRRPCLGIPLLTKLAAIWLAVVAALAGAGICLIPHDLSPTWMTIAAAVLLVPFNRLAVAPSALDWNRHR